MFKMAVFCHFGFVLRLLWTTRKDKLMDFIVQQNLVRICNFFLNINEFQCCASLASQCLFTHHWPWGCFVDKNGENENLFHFHPSDVEMTRSDIPWIKQRKIEFCGFVSDLSKSWANTKGIESPLPLKDPRDAGAQRKLNIPYRITC